MFVSYGSHFEDVLLWRALKHVGCGLYLELAGTSPAPYSAIRALYEAGWRGINVQQDAELFAALQKERPYDTNLNLAVSHNGERSALSAIWETHVRRRDVHILKIDGNLLVKGMLEGNDWERNRPWIVVIEAPASMEAIDSPAPWESLMLGANYRLAYRDGLNRFYLAAERSELQHALTLPPNMHDGFVAAQQLEAEARAQRAEQEAETARVQVQELRRQLELSEARMHKLKSTLGWRVDKASRKIVRQVAKAARKLSRASRRDPLRKKRGSLAFPDATTLGAVDTRLSQRILNTFHRLWRESAR